MGQYVEIATSTATSLNEIRARLPQMSIPEGADLEEFGYAELIEAPAPIAAPGFKVVSGPPVQAGGVWRTSWVEVPLDAADLSERTAFCWDLIKREHDRRAAMGVKVGAHWFHSDQKSRTQQIGLTKYIPPGTVWKTLTYSLPPVFVPMTLELAEAIVQATAVSDVAVFTAAEVHRMAMQASPDPGAYDFSGGWPPSFEDEAHEAGFAVDASVL